MDKFVIFETNRFIKDLERDLGDQRERIAAKLKNFVYPQLRLNPFWGKNVKKLKNYTPDTWRYRIGDYRFFYTVDIHSKTVSMLAIDHRKDAY
ncbi:MAG: type II toxin-antitoxin system RelE/ParE family toxin [Candidatus Omnitrophica bacterium]|nr:type II toxin-antitoxin system RelE/ParE family toxin [Candidatus Omnitrophota bacterium]